MLQRILLVTPVYLLVALAILANTMSVNQERATAEAKAISGAYSSQADIFNGDEEAPDIYIGYPNRLRIPRLGVEIDIAKGDYDYVNQTWTLSDNKAHFANGTKRLNNKTDGGLSLIYGHNYSWVLGQTEGLKKGDLIELYTANDLIFSYKFLNSKDVMPDDTEIFSYKGKPKLVLMSCTGTWNETRGIYSFELISVRSAE